MIPEIISCERQATFTDFFARYINTILSFIIGAAGGLIIPALTLGAFLGYVSAIIWNLSSTFMIILGLTSFLSPILKAPFTLSILIITLVQPGANLYIFVLLSSYGSYFIYYLINKLLSNLISMK